jgi:hypothetical protein
MVGLHALGCDGFARVGLWQFFKSGWNKDCGDAVMAFVPLAGNPVLQP